MDNILIQLYKRTKEGMAPLYSNSKYIEVNNLENVTEELLNDNYSEYDLIVDKGNGNVYKQYNIGKWSGIKKAIIGYIFETNNTQLNINADGDVINVKIISTKNENFIDFNFINISNWISIFKTQDNFIITVDKNESFQFRNGIITLIQNESGKVININIIQSSKIKHNYVFSVSPTVTIMKADGSSVFNPTVTSTKDGVAQSFSVDAKSDWLNVDIENNIITIIANENTGSSRAGFVRFIQNESGQTCGIDITQQGTDTFEIDGSSVANISADALTTTLNVVSIVNGEAHSPYTVESSPEWITATPNVQISKLGLQITANTGAARIGQIVCKQTATNETVTITVNQAAGSTPPTPTPTYVFSVSPTVTIMKADGSSVFNPTVTSTKDGVAQSFSVDAKSDWLNVDIENNIITIIANENTGSSRAGFVRFIQNESGQTCGIDITQQGVTPTPTPKCKVTVNSNPSDATIVLNNSITINSGEYAEFDEGSNITIVVSKAGYKTYTSNINNIQNDTQVIANLEELTDTYELTVNTTSFEFNSIGGNNQTSFVSTKNGQYNEPDIVSSDSWLRASVIEDGGTKYIQINVDNSTISRMGYITITNGDQSETINISQKVYTFNVNPLALNFNGEDTAKNITVVSTYGSDSVSFDIDTVSDNWIHYTISGNTISVSVDENTTTQSRTGSIRVRQNRTSPDTPAYETITITQNAADIQFEAQTKPITLNKTNDTKESIVVSTINNVNTGWTIVGFPNWLTSCTKNGNRVVVVCDANPSSLERSGEITLQQNTSGAEETIGVRQTGSTYEFVGILSGAGGDTEQPLDTAIRLTTADNSVTLTPRIKINSVLSQDSVNITAAGYSSGAQHTDKFNISNGGTSLSISTVGQEPSEPISTSYDITVSYDGRSENITFVIDWDV